MASEKAKENKTLVATCSRCGKTLSVEVLHGVAVIASGQRTTVPVCDECRDRDRQSAAS